MNDKRGIFRLKTQVISASLYTYWAWDVTRAHFVFTRFKEELWSLSTPHVPKFLHFGINILHKLPHNI